MKRVFLIQFLLLIVTPIAMIGAVNKYSFTMDTTVYTPINGAPLTIVADMSYDDLDIGFPFVYNGVSYNQFSVNENGYIGLGESVKSAKKPISDTGTKNIIAGLGGNLGATTISGSLTSKLEYAVVGVEPNRSLVVQWTNFEGPAEPNELPNQLSSLSFQIRLNESTNSVDIVYGVVKNAANYSYFQVGLKGGDNSDFSNRITYYNSKDYGWYATRYGTSIASICILNSIDNTETIKPQPGLTFTWTPPPPVPMSFVSSTTTQIVTDVARNVTEQILGIQITTLGGANPFALTSLTINSNGTTDFAHDIDSVKVYYTGFSPVFGTAQLFGAATSLQSPITGNTALSDGTNYFWVAYDVPKNAWINDTLDAECTSITLSGVGGTRVPAVTNPVGARKIGPWRKESDNVGFQSRHAVAFAIGTKAYVATGYNSSATANVWEFDSETGIWTQKTDFPGGARYHAVGFSIGDKGYLGTGYNGTYLKDFWEYNPTTDSWIQKANFLPRKGMFGASAGGQGYIGCGDTTGATMQDFYSYNPLMNQWTKKADLFVDSKSVGSYATAFSLGGKIYAGSGISKTGSEHSDFFEYSIEENLWRKKNNIIGSHAYATSFSLNDKAYLSTGMGSTNYWGLADFLLYDTTSNVWTAGQTPFPGKARYGAISFTIGNKGYIGLGYNTYINNIFLNDLWSFTAPLFVDLSANSTATCPGDTVIFSPVVAAPIVAWAWSFPGGTPSSSTEQYPKVIYSASGQYNVSLTVASEDGKFFATKDNFITINTPPDSKIEKGVLTNCSMQLSASSSQPGSGFISGYQWYHNGVAVQDANDVTYEASQTGDYHVVVTNSLGCSSSSNSIEVAQNVSPTALIDGDTLSCSGGTIVLSAAPSTAGAGTISGYQWKRNGVEINRGINVLDTATQDGEYTVVVSNSQGCSTESSPHKVRFSISPIVNLGADKMFCDSVELDAGNPGLKCQWSTGDTSQKIKVGIDGDYSVTVTNQAGCSARDTIHLTYNGLDAMITMPDTVAVNSSVNFQSNNSTATTWHWSFGDGGTSLKKDTSHTYLATGSYEVKLIVSNGTCSDTVKKIIVVVKPSNVIEWLCHEMGDMNIYPNPTEGKFVLSIGLKSSDAVKIKITNILGITVYEKAEKQLTNLNREIDLRNYAKGVYHVAVETSSGKMIRKIFVR